MILTVRYFNLEAFINQPLLKVCGQIDLQSILDFSSTCSRINYLPLGIIYVGPPSRETVKYQFYIYIHIALGGIQNIL